MTRVFVGWRSRTLVSVTAFVVALSMAKPVRAQTPAQPTVFDAGHGPISGSTRYIGLGGAFVGIAEDTEGVAVNPASSAVRLPYSWHPFNLGLGLDISIGALLPKNGNSSSNTALFGSLAAVINYQHLGFGLAAEAQSNAATRMDQAQGITPTNLTANFGVVHAGLAYGYLDGQLLIGAGPRIVGASLGGDSGLFSAGGVGYEAGVIVKPIAEQYRVAAAVKSPVDANVPSSRNTVHVPWELSFGFAYQFGPRPLNPKFVTAESIAHQRTVAPEPTDAEVDAAEDELFERYEKRQRFFLLVSTQLSVYQGGTQLLLGEDNDVRSERASPIFSPRLGLESEVIPHVLRLRAGSYYEPAPIDQVSGRVHGTGGFDVRLFRWNVFGLIKRFDIWKLSIGADAASSYLNAAFSIGFWH